MTTGERMKLRRKELGLNAETIATLLGVSPATIYRYENGSIENMSVDKLEPIARALKTTPAYLMGWEDSPEGAALPAQLELTNTERSLIAAYRQASPADRQIIDNIVSRYTTAAKHPKIG